MKINIKKDAISPFEHNKIGEGILETVCKDIDHYSVSLNYTRKNVLKTRFNIEDCQIIGRRISQMTSEEQAEYYDKKLDKFMNNINDNSAEQIFDMCDYLFDIGVFPSKYFDELKWVVEK